MKSEGWKMWKIYLKQIRYLLKENKFFSVVYIVGTALSIIMVMLILIIYHLQTANLGVENKRDRMLYITRGYQLYKDGDGLSSYNLDAKMVEDYFYHLKTPEAVSMVGKATDVIYNEREKLYKNIVATYTDAGYWKLFSFRFLFGQGFSNVDVEGKVRKIVVDESTARNLFGATDVIGRTLLLNGKDYQVCGVVEDVPSYLTEAYSHVWYPYTTTDQNIWKWGTKEVALGPMRFYILQRSTADREKITQELQHQVAEMNRPNKKSYFSLKDQPYTAWEGSFKGGNDSDRKEIQKKMTSTCILLLLLLLVPALNLSGLIVSRMKKRGDEIGIRKAFGASTSHLVGQMFLENLVQMLIGGMLGIVGAYGIFQWLRTELLPHDFMILYTQTSTTSSYVEFWHVISPITIVYVVLICFLLNLISTLLPAWRYARMPIVEALNRK